MIAIPKKLLPDTLTVREPDPSSDLGGKYLNPRTIKNVRFESKDELNPKVYQLAENVKGRIWIDSVNSEGAFAISRGAKVQVNDHDSMLVKNVAEYKGLFGRIHHWEVDCG